MILKGVLTWHGHVGYQDVKKMKVGVDTQPHKYSEGVDVMRKEPGDNTDNSILLGHAGGLARHKNS